MQGLLLTEVENMAALVVGITWAKAKADRV